MHLFDAATRFYGGNAIVGGGLPLAVGLALADKMLGRDAGDRLLLRRGRRGRGRIPREPEPGGALAAAGAVRLREQPLRHGHGARALRVPDRHLPARPRPTTCPAVRRRHGRDRRRGRGAAGRDRDPRRRGPAASWSAAPTVFAPTRCSTPSSTATRPRSKTGSRRDPIAALPALAAKRPACSTTAEAERIETEVEARARRGGRLRRSRAPGSPSTT